MIITYIKANSLVLVLLIYGIVFIIVRTSRDSLKLIYTYKNRDLPGVIARKWVDKKRRMLDTIDKINGRQRSLARIIQLLHV